jgi:negative regulator of sigma E activity
VDDRTDDCAFGARMSLALRQEFRKLRFQMIADTQGRPHSLQPRLMVGIVAASVLLEKLAQGGRFGFLQLLQGWPPF